MARINLRCHKDANNFYCTSSAILKDLGIAEEDIEASLENIADSYAKKGYSVTFTYNDSADD